MLTKVDLDAINWSNFSPEVIRKVERVIGLRPGTPRLKKRAGPSAVSILEATMTPEELANCKRREAAKKCFLGH